MTNNQELCHTIAEIGQARANGKKAVIPFPDGLLELEDGFDGFGMSDRPDGVTKNVKLSGILYPEAAITAEVPA